MTLKEIDEILPNGFHDAEIANLQWNFRENLVLLDIDFWVATDDSNREKRRLGSLELRGITFLVIDPPNLQPLDRKPYRGEGSLQIDGVQTTVDIFPKLSLLEAVLPGNTELFSFYVVNW